MKIFSGMSKQSKNKPGVNNPAASETAEEKLNGTAETDKSTDFSAPTVETAEDNEDKVAALNKKADELNDKYLRLYSEFDNYRKRVIKEKQDLSKFASEELIISLLPILDDFERAISTFEKFEGVEALKEGSMLIYNKLKNSLVQKGLQETEALGLAFDTDYHEAIANIPAPSEDLKNKIIDVSQKGYTLNGKVIRFAKVVVGS